MATFGWCMDGKHDECIREYEKFYFDTKTKSNRTGQVFTGEIIHCECPKRGCKCYVKAADRIKPTRKKKR